MEATVFDRTDVIDLSNDGVTRGLCAVDTFIIIMYHCGWSGAALAGDRTVGFSLDEARKIAELARTNIGKIPVKGHLVDRFVRVFEAGPVTATVTRLGWPHNTDEQNEEIVQSNSDLWR